MCCPRSFAAALELPWRGCLHDPGKCLRQIFSVGSKSFVRQANGVAIRQTPYGFRKLILSGHSRAIDKHGDDPHVACQCRFNLDPHKIARIVQAALSVFGFRIEPLGADDRKKYVAGLNPLRKDFLEVEAGFDVVDVEKELLA